MITGAIMTSQNGLYNSLRSGHYTREMGEKNINIIAKWVTDIDSENRMDGDLYMVSVAFKF